MAHYSLGHRDLAQQYLDEALDLYRQSGTPEGEAQTLNNVATLARAQDNLAQAQAYFLQALDINERSRNKSGQATNLNNLRAIAGLMDSSETAIAYYCAALALRREIEDNEGTARTLYNLAQAWIGLGDLSQAQVLLQEAVEMDRALGFANLERDQMALTEIEQELEDISR